MNKWTLLTILFALFTFGAIQETFRIFTSHDTDIVQSGNDLKIISVVITGALIVFTIVCLVKAFRK